MSKTHYQSIFGSHAVRQILANDISRVLEIWIQEGREDEKMRHLLTQAQQHGLSIQRVSKKTLDKWTDNGHHQGVFIRCKLPATTSLTLEERLTSLTVPAFFLVLDEVQDPHNLGACLRTADAAGIQAVIIPKHHACSLSPTVHKVACGAADTVPVIEVSNLATALRLLKEHHVRLVGADGQSQTSVYQTELTGPLALILGAEGKGLRRLTRELCDTLVRIPLFGSVESLNVSVAAGICVYEAVRQRIPK